MGELSASICVGKSGVCFCKVGNYTYGLIGVIVDKIVVVLKVKLKADEPDIVFRSYDFVTIVNQIIRCKASVRCESADACRCVIGRICHNADELSRCKHMINVFRFFI